MENFISDSPFNEPDSVYNNHHKSYIKRLVLALIYIKPYK